MFSWRKGHVVTEMVEEYISKADQCLGLFKMALEARIKKGDCHEFDELAQKAHIAESTCDDIRRRVEEELYEKALIPESRGDILHLLEKLDKLPNKADAILFEVSAELLLIPQVLAKEFHQLVHTNCECFQLLVKAVRLLFTAPQEMRPLIADIDKLESSADRLEREVIRAIFASQEIAPDQKILLKDLVIQISKISDLSENVGDALSILVVKRMV
ncbi:MAG: DUF47 family protein [Planctomycetes bacterium]|nr:DUF47 family protein [Planctomycetota bacterium]